MPKPLKTGVREKSREPQARAKNGGFSAGNGGFSATILPDPTWNTEWFTALNQYTTTHEPQKSQTNGLTNALFLRTSPLKRLEICLASGEGASEENLGVLLQEYLKNYQIIVLIW